MKKSLLIIFVVLLTVLAAGCMHAPAGLAASSKPLNPDDYEMLGHAEGSSSYMSVFGALPLGAPDYDAAIKDAISKVPGGTALINVRAYQSYTYVLFVAFHKLTVIGDVVGKR